MKSKAIFFLLASVIISIGCNEKKKVEIEPVTASVSERDMIEHGEYMVNILGCTDCHSPKKMTEKGPVEDSEKYLMGFDASQALPPVPENVPLGPWVLFAGDLTAAVGPWGTSYAGNLTPHETGIGNWTLEQFTKVLREAKFKGLDDTRPIMPPMPTHYAYLTDEDIEAIFGYLKTIKPIDNVVPSYQPPSK
jgi:hypothetical protein